ncbi:MAG: type II toxin-antitoxin system RelE/ParE family toxin [gamma proteobacterium endosymbiont of Lamellibrachia anaximandri]|nr:type II toxin-antitoxin system RelE/ParE family toxin [gamma proteobacterium endosymbiont of Lamellibrachia anaximandri]MBL3534337.1 type II toxin-antitoxin system RelE/ParE family toxin [gamma proteobacterium endosymbiont of Lamellibrachia anaximandri]MBL3599934.1 type II toxin-antitoxin system RelE/ParE family toxin [gamma proteobacterium endosymbiont of Lamellibrachia anaximandri]
MAVFQKTAQAEEDLIDIWLYIAQDNPAAADHLLDTFEEKGWLLAENPNLGQARPDIAEDFHHLPVGRYLLLYRKIPGGIELVRVAHGMRMLDAL